MDILSKYYKLVEEYNAAMSSGSIVEEEEKLLKHLSDYFELKLNSTVVARCVPYSRGFFIKILRPFSFSEIGEVVNWLKRCESYDK